MSNGKRKASALLPAGWIGPTNWSGLVSRPGPAGLFAIIVPLRLRSRKTERGDELKAKRSLGKRSAALVLPFLLLLASAGCASNAGRTTPPSVGWFALGPEGQWTRIVAIDPTTPTTIYAGGGFSTSKEWIPGGLIKSSDGGVSWGDTGLVETDVFTFAIDPVRPSTLYAGTANGVQKSTDGGATWGPADPRLVTRVQALAMDPETPATLYAGSWGEGVFRSTDGGRNFRAANTGLTGTDVVALGIDPVTPSTLYAGTLGQGLFKSTDGGQSWRAASADLADKNVLGVAIDPQTPTTLYASVGTRDESGRINYTVYKSADGGGSWRVSDTGLTGGTAWLLTIGPGNPASLYTATEDGLFISTDGGGRWNPIATGLTDIWFLTLAFDPHTPANLYAGTSNGVYAFRQEQ